MDTSPGMPGKTLSREEITDTPRDDNKRRSISSPPHEVSILKAAHNKYINSIEAGDFQYLDEGICSFNKLPSVFKDPNLDTFKVDITEVNKIIKKILKNQNNQKNQNVNEKKEDQNVEKQNEKVIF